MWKLFYSLILAVFGLVSCSNTKIFPAQELDVLYSKNPTSYQAFFIENKFFQKTSCQEIEKWAKTNLTISSNNIDKDYLFLNYDEALTKANPNLAKEYDVIILDDLVCQMDGRDKKCFICRDNK